MRNFTILAMAASAALSAVAQNVTVDLKENRTCTMSNGIITLSIDAEGYVQDYETHRQW